MSSEPTYSVFGDHAVLLDWSAQISEQTHHLVVQTERTVKAHFHMSIIETVVTYHSLAVYLKGHVQPEEFIETLRRKVIPISEVRATTGMMLTIPVCYDPIFGLDLIEVSKLSNRSHQEIIELHTQPIYQFYFMGFLPGFPYLGGLMEDLHIPRKTSPRKIVEEGSVAIGGIQTGIYPCSSPGGWNIVGKTPIKIFDIKQRTPSIFHDIEKVRFRAISRSEFDFIAAQMSKGSYRLEKGVWNG